MQKNTESAAEKMNKIEHLMSKALRLKEIGSDITFIRMMIREDNTCTALQKRYVLERINSMA